MMWSKFSKKIIRIVTALLVGLSPMSVKALTQEQLEMFAQNNILFYDPGNETECLSEADEFFDRERNASIVIGELIEAGYSHDSALAIAGNLAGESNFDPRSLEKKYERNASIAVVKGWKAWENGGKTFDGGFGLAQWTTNGRVQRLQEYADAQHMWVGSLGLQIKFIVEELSGSYNASPEQLNAMSFEEATWHIYRRYEAPGVSFWVDHDGNHYNDYAPSSLADLSETATPAAWAGYNSRLNNARNLMDLEPTRLSGNCSDGGDSNLAEIAVSMAWPDEDGRCETESGQLIKWSIKNRERCGVKPKYREVVESLYGRVSKGYYKDCGKFVGAAVKYSGIDPSFPKGYTLSIRNYLSKSSNWTEIENLGNTSNLQPGDIFIVRYGNGGHVFIYTGDISKYGNRADASLNKRTGNMGKVYYKEKRDNGTFYYQIFRYTGGGSAEQ